jgi:hypothetical protein
MMMSAKGREYDMVFIVKEWILKELAGGTGGQIYSGTMSDDHNWLAIVGGWLGSDRRGHNGVFILQRQPLGPGFEYWKLKSWFDARGMTIGEIEFGPGDTVFTTSHNENPGGSSPLITAFTFEGQKIGSFIASPQHGDLGGAGACRRMRFEKTGPASYALYDPESSSVRFLTVSFSTDGPQMRQERTVSIKLPRPSVVQAFDIADDGRIAVAHTWIDNDHHGHSFVSLFSSTGEVVDEWPSPRVWRYAYFAGHQLNGVYPNSSDDPRGVVRSVAIK